jgi:Uma2 family endonuclease
MSLSTTPITAEQLFDMPSDGMRRELVKGELIRMNPAGSEHGVVIAALTVMLGQHVLQHKLGQVFGAETGFVLARDPDTVRAPDIAFVRQERIAVTGIPRAYFPGAPDLAVGGVSPGDRPSEVEAKVSDWLAHGCLLVWVVDPRNRTVAIHRTLRETQVVNENDLLEEPGLFPGWRVNVAKIFPA